MAYELQSTSFLLPILCSPWCKSHSRLEEPRTLDSLCLQLTIKEYNISMGISRNQQSSSTPTQLWKDTHHIKHKFWWLQPRFLGLASFSQSLLTGQRFYPRHGRLRIPITSPQLTCKTKFYVWEGNQEDQQLFPVPSTKSTHFKIFCKLKAICKRTSSLSQNKWLYLKQNMKEFNLQHSHFKKKNLVISNWWRQVASCEQEFKLLRLDNKCYGLFLDAPPPTKLHAVIWFIFSSFGCDWI